MRRWLKILLVLLIVVPGAARLAQIAAVDAPTADEESGIGESYSIPASELLRRGPPVEVNPSSLNYLIDKAWILLHGNEPHRSYNLNLFFRALPILYLTAGTAVAALLCLELAAVLGLPFLPSLLFALVAALFFQANPVLLRHTALNTRPYSLWFFFSCLQLLLLLRAREKPSWKIGVLHFLMCWNSFGAATQVAVATLVRAGGLFRRDKLRPLALLLLEAVPAALVSIWYWIGAPRMHMPAPGQRGYADLWMEGLSIGFWAPSKSFLQHIYLNEDWGRLGWPALVVAIAVPVLLPFLIARPCRRLALSLLLMLVSALPVTWVALEIANSFQPRYFMFLYPALGLAHILAVLGFAAWIAGKTKSLHAASAVLLLWAGAQAYYRVPEVIDDTREIKVFPRYAYYVSEPLPGCPADLGTFRRGVPRGASPGDIDLSRTQNACLPVVEPLP
jgi:hypothetical protein